MFRGGVGWGGVGVGVGVGWILPIGTYVNNVQHWRGVAKGILHSTINELALSTQVLMVGNVKGTGYGVQL